MYSLLTFYFNNIVAYSDYFFRMPKLFLPDDSFDQKVVQIRNKNHLFKRQILDHTGNHVILRICVPTIRAIQFPHVLPASPTETDIILFYVTRIINMRSIGGRFNEWRHQYLLCTSVWIKNFYCVQNILTCRWLSIFCVVKRSQLFSLQCQKAKLCNLYFIFLVCLPSCCTEKNTVFTI